MSDFQSKENKTHDISGLALALLLDETSTFYCELLGFCENKNHLIEKKYAVSLPRNNQPCRLPVNGCI